MICPACGGEDEIVARFFDPDELEPVIVVETGDTVKTRRNPKYRGPDVGHVCPGHRAMS